MQKYGIVFPGQGSQSVGMLADFAINFPVVKQTFDQASDVLGYDLWQLSQEGPAEKLDTTTHTQPALLAGGYAIWRVIQEQQKIHPVVLAGHSLGEYTALVCANSLEYLDAIKLVAARGQFMQEAVKPGEGAMAALIGLDEEVVKQICIEAKEGDEILSPANFNSVGQIVIAGHQAAVNRATALAKEKGAKMAVLIPVSVPSHCELMRSAAERLAEKLGTVNFQTPTIPVISNVDVKQYDSAESIRDGLTRQLFMPVRWVETIQAFNRLGITNVVECGPGKILTGLNKRIDKSLQVETFNGA